MSQSIPPELASRLELAYGRIAGDANLMGDLLDAEAQVLLAWAQEEVTRLVQQSQGMEDETAWAMLDPKLSQLRRYLRRTAKVAAASEHPTQTLKQILASSAYPEPEPELEPEKECADAASPEHDSAPLVRRSLFSRLFRKRGKQ